MTLTRVLALSGMFLIAVGCGGNNDDDNDGLTNAQEKELGLDKDNPDFDGDGWLDGEEVEYDSDPDDDGEVVAPVRGNPILNFEVTDETGEKHMLRELASQGKPILIDTSAAWCPPCRDMAAWLDNLPSSGNYDRYNNVRSAVDSGDVLWVTFISQNVQYGDPGLPTIEAWHAEYPHPNVPVLVDHGQTFAGWQQLVAFPTTMWVNPDMTIQQYNPDDNTLGLERLSNNLDRALSDAADWRDEQAALAAAEE